MTASRYLAAVGRESVVFENNRHLRRATLQTLGPILRDFRQAFRAASPPGEAPILNYLLLAVLLAVLHLRPAFACLLLRRCPSLLPPEAEEAYHRFISLDLEYY